MLRPLRFSITVPGNPVGKGRPQVVRPAGQRPWAITPKKTVQFESDIKTAFAQKYPDAEMIRGAVAIRIWAYFAIPASDSRAKHERKKTGKELPTKKPDLDNIEKAVLDALNGVAYIDDSHVTKKTAEKFYSEQPRVEIEIYEDIP